MPAHTRAAGPSIASRRIPFRLGIVTVVVGLLLATCVFLIVFLLTKSRQTVDVLKRDYLTEVAESASREIHQLTRDAQQVLRAQQVRIETGVYQTRDSMVLARTLATVLKAVPTLEWA